MERALSFIESKINKHRRGIKVYWWRPYRRGRRNFGDEITPVIIERIWGVRCLRTRIADSDMVGAGSLIELVNEFNPKGHKINVWGSGLLQDGPEMTNEDIIYHLVRGPLTAGRIRSDAQKVPLGDPGLLASTVFEASGIRKKARIGVVPHMRDLKSEGIRSLGGECLIISPYQSPAKVAKDITSCEVVFSSSLHGLIFADSFKVPNFRLKHNELEGGDYKFNDYYLSTNRESISFSIEEVVDIAGSPEKLRDIKDLYVEIYNLSQIQDNIKESFPLNPKNEIVG